MNKLFTILSIAVFTSGSALAANDQSNFYVGLDYVHSNFPEIPSASKKDGSGYAIQLGYQLPSSSSWTNAFEVEYINLGTAKYNFDDTALGIKGSGELELTAINLSYKPRFYLGRFFIGGQVGYANLSASGKASYTVNGNTTSSNLADKVDSGFTFGGELGMLITDQLSIKGGYRVIESDTNTLFAGLAFNF
ncbi:outer membrane beta-barrel protein [Vibrio sp. MACH09]|uniref:outer membrane beta-barrel protein n=1 Tax=Vibrio sp. MACH09 TaxID=3025122 RepID=UPI00295EF139|nr:outer membrane beta-barrel protein [Vibrio sp. MACH09]